MGSIPVAGAKSTTTTQAWLLCFLHSHANPSSKLALNWFRISAKSRCQLASIRLGRNSSLASLLLTTMLAWLVLGVLKLIPTTIEFPIYV